MSDNLRIVIGAKFGTRHARVGRLFISKKHGIHVWENREFTVEEFNADGNKVIQRILNDRHTPAIRMFYLEPEVEAAPPATTTTTIDSAVTIEAETPDQVAKKKTTRKTQHPTE